MSKHLFLRRKKGLHLVAPLRGLHSSVPHCRLIFNVSTSQFLHWLTLRLLHQIGTLSGVLLRGGSVKFGDMFWDDASRSKQRRARVERRPQDNFICWNGGGVEPIFRTPPPPTQKGAHDRGPCRPSDRARPGGSGAGGTQHESKQSPRRAGPFDVRIMGTTCFP